VEFRPAKVRFGGGNVEAIDVMAGDVRGAAGWHRPSAAEPNS
jgi:hypothetical protein